VAAARHVVCAQNHDQVGNRMLGERLTALTSFAGLKLAATAVLLSPYLPLLFMGEEYGETAPFQYFIHHGEPGLVEAVRNGRREEFAAFAWMGEPPDPQAPATFERSRLDWSLRGRGDHRVLLDWYRELIRLRREVPALARLSKESLEVTFDEGARLLRLRRWAPDSETVIAFNFGERTADGAGALVLPAGRWVKLLDSAEPRWSGEGSGLPAEVESDGAGREAGLPLASRSVAVFVRDDRS
jgi:maltooligosyltrehalose trehalohydrolase